MRCAIRKCFLNPVCISLLQGKGRLLKHSGWCNLAMRRLTWHQWTDLATAIAVSRAQSSLDAVLVPAKTAAKTRVEQEGMEETTEDYGEVSKVLEVALSLDWNVRLTYVILQKYPSNSTVSKKCFIWWLPFGDSYKSDGALALVWHSFSSPAGGGSTCFKERCKCM